MATKTLLTELLGYDPVEEDRKRYLASQRQFSNPYEGIGYGLGRLLGTGVGKLFNIQDPETTKISSIQSAMTKAGSQFQVGTADYFEELARNLADSPSAQANALKKAQEARQKEDKEFRETTKFIADNPEALTAEATRLSNIITQKATRVGIDLRIDPNTGALLNPITPEIQEALARLPESQRLSQLTQAATRGSMEIARKEEEPSVKSSENFARVAGELGFGVKPRIGDYTQDQIKKVNAEIQLRQENVQKAGLPPQEKALLESTSKTRSDILTAALNSTNQKRTADRIDAILNDAFVGFGQNAKLTVGQVASALGVELKGVSATEQLTSLLNSLAQGQAKTLPGSLTEKELKFLREAIGTGNFTLGTLKSMVRRIREDAISAQLENEGVQTVINTGGDLNRFDFVGNRTTAQRRAKAVADQEEKEREEYLRLLQKRGGRK